MLATSLRRVHTFAPSNAAISKNPVLRVQGLTHDDELSRLRPQRTAARRRGDGGSYRPRHHRRLLLLPIRVGLAPCPLCLEQRNAYYVSVPLAALLWLGAGYGASAQGDVARLSGDRRGHAVEHRACRPITPASNGNGGRDRRNARGPINNVGSATDLLSSSTIFSPIRCDEAAWRFLGLSLAGYDVLVSLALALVALWGAKAALALQN